MIHSCIILSTIFILFLSLFKFTYPLNQDSLKDEWISVGDCRKLWRNDRLIGKCFGLNPHNEFPELKNVVKVDNSKQCRSICCHLGDKCVSWQYQNSTAECKLGPAVRLGFEGSNTDNWCDPHPPSKWNGYRLLKRSDSESDTYVCRWDEQLPNQCIGLGPERLNSTKGALTTAECASECCNDKTCDMWQEMKGRGCYYGSKSSVWCDKPQGNHSIT